MRQKKFNFYGRRVGKPLNTLNKQLLETLLPRYEILPDLYKDSSIPLKKLFPKASSFSLEIGFGTGTHLFSQAKSNPFTGFIGSEPYLSGVSQLLKKLQKTPLDNLLISLKPIQELLLSLEKASLDNIYVLFPDPWPKKRHNKRRIINPSMLKVFSNYLKPSGTLTVSTDHPDYIQWIESLFEESPLVTIKNIYNLTPHQRPLNWPMTRFEKKAHQVGRICKVYEVLLASNSP